MGAGAQRREPLGRAGSRTASGADRVGTLRVVSSRVFQIVVANSDSATSAGTSLQQEVPCSTATSRLQQIIYASLTQKWRM